jgi:non-homologous end joining protein Ku
MMQIMKHLNGVHDMKRLQTKLIATQTQKKDRQAQMEPIQEQAVEVIGEEEEAKKNMAQTHAKMINNDSTMQVLDALRENTMQAKTQENELT